MENPVVHILLATYNGEKFLRRQLDSLLTQTYKDFTVLARDDGSTDQTLNILSEYVHKFPGKFNILNDEIKNAGAAHNFGILLSKSEADYIFFCDQDDIWMDNKVETELQKIRALETDAAVPCMVFSDMTVIDEEGNIIHESLWRQLHLHPDFFTLNRLLVQNIPHGCTVVINKAMRRLACPVPKEVILHDHWIALLAASCGRWDFIATPTVLLRNHAQNVTRRKTSVSDKLKRFSVNFFSGKEYEYFIRIRVNQAKALQLRCSSCMIESNSDIVNNFILLESTSGLARKKLFLQNKFYRTTFWHTLKMILRA